MADLENGPSAGYNRDDDPTSIATTTTNNKHLGGSTPSLISPVGAASRIYSVALDEDDMMDMSPLASNPHPPLHTTGSNPNRFAGDQNSGAAHMSPDRQRNRFWGNNDYEEEEDEDDLPRPLLGHNYRHEDDDDHDSHHQHYRRRHRRHHHHPHHYHPHLRNNHHQHNSPPKLNGLNYLNVITYVLNVFTSYFIGVRGLFGVLPTRADIFLEYETLVTPADYAYYLWAPILVFEFFFATAQLFPHYRARPIIQQGTGFYFFWACIIQTVWTVFFAMRWFVLSFIAVVLALLCLVLLLASQHYNCLCVPTLQHRGGGILQGLLSSATGIPRQRRKSLMEYWFFRFPFYLHCGWLLVCTIVQFSMVFRYRFTDSTGAQLAADIISLGVLLPPGTFFLTGQSSGPDFVIPIVIIWSYISIGVELNKASDTLVDLYGHPAIVAVQNASWVFTGLIGLMLVPRIIVWIAQECCTIDVVELNDDDDDDGLYDFESSSARVLPNHNTSSNENDGYLHRLSVRQQEQEQLDETLGSIRRRIGSDDYILEEDDDEEIRRYEDCHEIEHATNEETTTATTTELTEE